LKVVKAIGLMSGTSLDGVDVALIETDGERITAFGPIGYRPYSDEERALLRAALAAGVSLTDRGARPGVLAKAEAFVTRVHGEAIETFLATEHIDKAAVAIVGFHGQTVLHRPSARLTARRSRGVSASRSPMIFARQMSPQAGRARRWCLYSIRLWRAIWQSRTPSRFSMSAASPT
jgi:anhydro-N-acetylmuramic acid kinase